MSDDYTVRGAQAAFSKEQTMWDRERRVLEARVKDLEAALREIKEVIERPETTAAEDLGEVARALKALKQEQDG